MQEAIFSLAPESLDKILIKHAVTYVCDQYCQKCVGDRFVVQGRLLIMSA